MNVAVLTGATVGRAVELAASVIRAAVVNSTAVPIASPFSTGGGVFPDGRLQEARNKNKIVRKVQIFVRIILFSPVCD
jgi:hypothetical protein